MVFRRSVSTGKSLVLSEDDPSSSRKTGRVYLVSLLPPSQVSRPRPKVFRKFSLVNKISGGPSLVSTRETEGSVHDLPVSSFTRPPVRVRSTRAVCPTYSGRTSSPSFRARSLGAPKCPEGHIQSNPSHDWR